MMMSQFQFSKSCSAVCILTDVVLVWVVECVDDGRLGSPLVGVDGLPELLDVALRFEAQDVEEVLQEGLGVDHQLREDSYVW